MPCQSNKGWLPIQREKAGELAVAGIQPCGRVLVGYLGEGVEKRPLGALLELLMPRLHILIEDGEDIYPVEIKSGQTVSGDMMGGLDYWCKLDGTNSGMLIYGGSDNYTRNGIKVRSWAFV